MTMLANNHILMAVGFVVAMTVDTVIRKWAVERGQDVRAPRFIVGILIIGATYGVSTIHEVRTWIDINVLRMRYEQALQKDIVRRLIWDPKMRTVTKDLSKPGVAALTLSVLRNGTLRLDLEDLDSLLEYNRQLLAASPSACAVALTQTTPTIVSPWEELPNLPREVVDRWAAAFHRAISSQLKTLKSPLSTPADLETFMAPNPAPALPDSIVARFENTETRCEHLLSALDAIRSLEDSDRVIAARSYLAGPPFSSSSTVTEQ